MPKTTPPRLPSPRSLLPPRFPRSPLSPISPRAPFPAALALTLTALALTACGGSSDSADADHHEADTIETAGRLAISEAAAPAVRIHDLDQAAAVEARHAVEGVPSAVYASPGGRYAVVYQGTAGLVQFIDGGIWQEDHGNHLHDYRQASSLTTLRLEGARPSHFNVEAGQQAAVFMDGNAEATPPATASVIQLTEAGITAGRAGLSLTLPSAIHGLAVPAGRKLLTVARADDASDALPTHLDLFLEGTGQYQLANRIPARCDRMHGAASGPTTVVAGCADGMLLVRHTGETTVDAGTKLATPIRVSTVASHPGLPDHYIGIGNEGVAPAPVTTRFFAVDGAGGTVDALEPEGWAEGRIRRAHGFDRHGDRFFILDDEGTLIVMQRVGAQWQPLARLPSTVTTMPTAAPWPTLASNGARDEIYLTDPVARQLIVLDAHTGSPLARHDLGYVPSALAWVGIAR